MPTTPERVWRAIHGGRGATRRRRPRSTPTRRVPAGSSRPEQPPGRRSSDPRHVRLRPAVVGRRGRRGAGRGRRGRQGPRRRAVPDPGAAAAARRPRRCSSTSAGSPSCAASATTATRIVIGAMTHPRRRHARRPRPGARALLAQATQTVADPQVRHRGTFGGALAHADPAGDLGAVALALDAELVIAGGVGRADACPAADFFVDYFTTALGEDEILTAIRVPKLHRLGQRTTRSSTGSRRPGRSSRSRRRCGSKAARSPRPASG